MTRRGLEVLRRRVDAGRPRAAADVVAARRCCAEAERASRRCVAELEQLASELVLLANPGAALPVARLRRLEGAQACVLRDRNESARAGVQAQACLQAAVARAAASVQRSRVLAQVLRRRDRERRERIERRLCSP